MKTGNTINTKFNSESFVILEALLCLIIVYATIFQRPDFVSLAFTASFILLLYHFILFLTRTSKYDKRINILLSIIILSLINILISSILAGAVINNFSYFQSYFIFLSSPILFCLAVDCKINRKTENRFFIMQALIALAYPYCYYFLSSQNDHSVGVTFNFSNPNLAGMFIFPTVLYMVLGVIRYKGKNVRTIFIILAIVNAKMMYDTGSRNTLLALTIFFAIIIWAYIKQRYSFSNWFLAIFSYLPIAFVPVYLLFINVIIEKGWLSFMVAEGKKLNSRVRVWREFFLRLDGKWITGNYANASGNSHNSHMVVLCSFGVIVLVLVIIFIYKILLEINSKSNTFYDVCCISAFCAVLFMGIGEGAIYSGGQGIYILCGSFLFLMNIEKSDDNINIINNFKNNYFSP